MPLGLDLVILRHFVAFVSFRLKHLCGINNVAPKFFRKGGGHGVGAAHEQRSCVCHSLALNAPVSCSSRIALDICAMSRLTLATMSAADPGFEGAMTALAAEIKILPPATLYLTLSKLSTKGLRLLLDESISVVSDRLNAGDTSAPTSGHDTSALSANDAAPPPSLVCLRSHRLLPRTLRPAKHLMWPAMLRQS